jgi:hypothetical protein
MFELSFGLIVGACVGYGMRAYLSYYRRTAAKRHFGVS